MRNLRLVAAVVCVSIGAALGCGGGGSDAVTSTSTPAGPTTATVTVGLSSTSVVQGGTVTATATPLDQNGAIITGRSVTWSTGSALVATINTAGLVTAVGPGQAAIIATIDGKQGQAILTVATVPANAVTLAAGQPATFLTSPALNTTLNVAQGAQYLIAVVNTDTAAGQTEGFTIAGSFTTGASAASRSTVSAMAPPRTMGGRAAAPLYPMSSDDRARIPAARQLGQNHMALLDENRKVFAKFGNPRTVRARLNAQTARSAPANAAVSQTVGTVNKVYVRNSLSGTCTTVDSIGARTVAVGQHVIVLADTTSTWTQTNRPDTSFYQTFASEYDQLTYPHILANIGNPLAYDAELSATGKITVVITPVLNNFPGLGGGSVVAFVNGCDFFPFASSGPNADYSNQTETFYSWVAGSAGYTIPLWEEGLRATAAHETKHIVSYTDRILNNSPVFEDIWLEEGLAQESAEIWERNFNQAGWKSHATFVQTVGCELSLGLSCDAAGTKPLALVASHLPFFFGYLQGESVESEGLGLDTYANYGAGWTLARWATDQYAAPDEATFIKSLINEPTLNGMANLSQHTGQSIATLLVYWNLATAIFQTPGYTASDIRTTIPSFNFADIFNVGQTELTCGGVRCGLFTSTGTPVFPIQPTALMAGTLSQTVASVPGTSASYFLLSTPSAGLQTLQLLNTAGGAVSAASGLRVGILRVQ